MSKIIGFRDDSFNLPDPYAITSMTPVMKSFYLVSEILKVKLFIILIKNF